MKFLLVFFCAASFLESASAADFVVTNANPTGPGSLAQAITDANNTAGADRVVFNIPDSDVKRIDLSTAPLPQITDALIIDGYTQPGASPNTLSVGDNAVILIQLDGGGAPENGLDGLIVSAPNCVVRGLSLTGFLLGYTDNTKRFTKGGNAILLGATDCTVEGNFIGVLPDGQTEGSNGTAVWMMDTGHPNICTVGGDQAAARNLISGCRGNAIAINRDLIVSGNYIGTDATGTKAIPNQLGILVVGSESKTIIGGVSPGAGNLISGNRRAIDFGGEGRPGFRINGDGVNVEGNLIGVQADGVTPLPNGASITILFGSNNTIGGLEPGAGNVIAFNGSGINLTDLGDSFGNRILSNSIYANRGLAIDLNADGATPNDPMDADSGPNHLQNYPVITSAQINNNAVTIQGTLNSNPSTQFTVQYFAESQSFARPVQTYLGSTSAMTDANGDAAFSAVFPLSDTNVTFNVTATSASGDTSEFLQNAERFRDISARAKVGADDNAMIAGFVITGQRELVFRALGPSLNINNAPIPGRLSDPTLEIYDSSGTLLAQNHNWHDDSAAATHIQSLGLAPTDDAESAIIRFLPGPGSYTAVIRGKNNSSGIGVIEVYDVTSLDFSWMAGTDEAANISTRALVEGGDNVLIGGFIVGQSSGATRIVARAIAPSLTNFGITNPLADPTLELRDSQGGLIASNDNWQDGQPDDLNTIGLAPHDDRESAIFLRLNAGAYTAIVRGKDAIPGVALVELYNLH